jgi:PAS domain S-box-containing protein
MHDITEILDCIPDRERISTAIHDLIERNIPFDTTYRIHPADGSEDRYLSSIGELHYDEEGKPVKVFGVIQDITEKYLLMEDLRQNQEKLSALFNSRILGSVFSDIHGSIFEANDEFLRIIGYTREEFLRGRVKWTDITPPEYRARDAEAITEAHETGVCTPYEKQYIRRDGSRIWVLTGYVLIGEAREEAVAFVLDISTSKANEERIQSLNLELEERVIERTNQLQFINEELQAEVQERRSAEKKLFETLSVLSATIESTPDGIFVVDNNRNISVYNKMFAEMWQIPDSVLRFGDERAVLKEQAVRVKNPGYFCSRIAEIYQNPELDSFDVIELADNRIFERTSRPQRIEYTIVGRVFSFRDVTKQKEMEEQIATSLREKEILLKEIHHRVKNNMQVVSSLLFMQARSTQQPEVRDILLESQNRIRSIALVHEKLYQSEDFKKIDYKDYLERIAHHIFESYQISPGSIHLDVRSEAVFLSIEKAVPLSLIINELITNSIKHAFPKGLSGEIRIDFSLENSRYRLIYQDSGPGIPDKGAIEKPDTLGMQLIRGLAGQLNGTVRYETYQGFGYIIEFPA